MVRKFCNLSLNFVGIPSVVYGFIGLTVVVPAIRNVFGGTGLGLLSGVFVLFVMILPTVTSMTVDAMKAVPSYYKEASLTWCNALANNLACSSKSRNTRDFDRCYLWNGACFW